MSQPLVSIAGRKIGPGHPPYIVAEMSGNHNGEIERALAQPRTPRLQDWCRICEAAIVEWPTAPHDPFFNVNTPDELAEAERIAAEFDL